MKLVAITVLSVRLNNIWFKLYMDGLWKSVECWPGTKVPWLIFHISRNQINGKLLCGSSKQSIVGVSIVKYIVHPMINVAWSISNKRAYHSFIYSPFDIRTNTIIQATSVQRRQCRTEECTIHWQGTSALPEGWGYSSVVKVILSYCAFFMTSEWSICRYNICINVTELHTM